MAAGGAEGDASPTTSRIGSPSSRSWSPRRSRTARAASELARLADEQAALRRVATLVAREVAAGRGLRGGRRGGRDGCSTSTRRGMVRYERRRHGHRRRRPGATRDDRVPVGTRLALEGENVVALVLRTGRPARMRRLREGDRRHRGALGRELGIRSAVGGPIVVDGRLWGAMIVASRAGRAAAGRTRGADRGVHRAGRDGDLEHPGARRSWRRRARGSWRRPTRSAGGWFAICTTARSSGWSTRSSR